jgi:hypothetical protein
VHVEKAIHGVSPPRPTMDKPMFLTRRALTLGFAVALLAMPSATAQVGPGSQGSNRSSTAGLTREELVRRWDLDGDGTISKSEADIARARMRRERTEMQLDAGIDPVTGLPRGESAKPAQMDEPPPYELPPEVPTTEPADQDVPGKPKSTRPKPMAELLAPITTKDPVPGLPRMPNLSGKPSDGPTQSAPERSSRASWLPPTKTGTTGLGGPRAGSPPAVSGYGSNAWSDLNAGRFRAMQYEADKAPAHSGGPPTTGGGLLPTARKPGQTGALILPGQTSLRPTTQAPLAPPAPRQSTFSPPRVTAEDIGGYGP